MRQFSFWPQEEQKLYPVLRGRRKADAVVVGGGLSGLTVALWLCRAGLKVALLEAETLGFGASSRCAGIVSLGLGYARLEKRRGQAVAAAYARTQQSALLALKGFGHASGWEDADASFVAAKEAPLLAEQAAMSRAGVVAEVGRATQSPLPGEYALCQRSMGMLQPMQHLRVLALLGEEKGLEIYEHSRVVALETNLAYTERGSVIAPYLVIATGYPVVNTPGWYFLRLTQRKSALWPLPAAEPFQGMYLNAGGGYALRPLKEGMLFVQNSRRMEGESELERRYRTAYAPLLGGGGQLYPGMECYAADGVPYIGAYGKKTPNLFVATGYGGRGLMGSMVAAQAVSAKVLGLDSADYAVYSGQRMDGATLSDEMKTALGIGGRYMRGIPRFSAPRCPHMGCKLVYRPKERLWECPCHGSRFDSIGHVLNAPATKDALIKHNKRG